jgi:hypothetical protein
LNSNLARTFTLNNTLTVDLIIQQSMTSSHPRQVSPEFAQEMRLADFRSCLILLTSYMYLGWDRPQNVT